MKYTKYIMSKPRFMNDVISQLLTVYNHSQVDAEHLIS